MVDVPAYVPSSFGLNQTAEQKQPSTYTGPTPGGTSGYQETKTSPASTPVSEPPPRQVTPVEYPERSISDVVGPGLNISVPGRQSTFAKDVKTDIKDVPKAPYVPSSVGISHTPYTLVIIPSVGLNQGYQSQLELERRYWENRISAGMPQTPYSVAGGAKVQQESYYYYLTAPKEPEIPILPSFGLRQYDFTTIGASEGAPEYGEASFWDFISMRIGVGDPKEQRIHNWLWEPSSAQRAMEEGAVFWQGIARQQAGGKFYDLTAPSPNVAVPRIVEYPALVVPGVYTGYQWRYMSGEQRKEAVMAESAIVALIVMGGIAYGVGAASHASYVRMMYKASDIGYLNAEILRWRLGKKAPVNYYNDKFLPPLEKMTPYSASETVVSDARMIRVSSTNRTVRAMPRYEVNPSGRQLSPMDTRFQYPTPRESLRWQGSMYNERISYQLTGKNVIPETGEFTYSGDVWQQFKGGVWRPLSNEDLLGTTIKVAHNKNIYGFMNAPEGPNLSITKEGLDTYGNIRYEISNQEFQSLSKNYPKPSFSMDEYVKSGLGPIKKGTAPKPEPLATWESNPFDFSTKNKPLYTPKPDVRVTGGGIRTQPKLTLEKSFSDIAEGQGQIQWAETPEGLFYPQTYPTAIPFIETGTTIKPFVTPLTVVAPGVKIETVKTVTTQPSIRDLQLVGTEKQASLKNILGISPKINPLQSPKLSPETLTESVLSPQTLTQTQTKPITQTQMQTATLITTRPITTTRPDILDNDIIIREDPIEEKPPEPPFEGEIITDTPEDEDEEDEKKKKKKKKKRFITEVSPLEGLIPGLDIYLPVTSLPKSRPVGTLTETIAGTKARTKATPTERAVVGAKVRRYRSDQRYLGRTIYARNLGSAI